MSKEEAIKQLEIILQNIIKERKQGIASIEGIKFQEALETILNLIQKQEKIIDYSIDRILPSPEEYLEIKNIMKQNKWGYDRSKKEYFKKEVEKDVKD